MKNCSRFLVVILNHHICFYRLHFRFFPVRGSDEKLYVDEILLLLNNRIKNGYDTLKKAFLQLDKVQTNIIFLMKLFEN